MERRIQLATLRGSDPLTLQVTIADVLRRPIRQLEPEALTELLALSEADGLDGDLAKEMASFVERAGKEIADIPDGTLWAEFLGEFSAIAAGRLPTCFRDLLQTELADGKRDQTSCDATQTLLDSIKDTDPETFDLGKGEANIQRTKVVAKPKGGGETKSGIGKVDTKAKKPRKKAVKVVDPVREKFIRDLCLERLQGYLDKGLSETVLITGVTFMGRKTYSNLARPEIMNALKRLLDDGLARKSAGRWIMERHW